jgi:urea transport system ATP-binding protein
LNENQIVQAGIGRKFQTPSIYDDQTVFESLEISFPRGRTVFGALTFQRDAEVKARVQEIAEMVFLADKLLSIYEIIAIVFSNFCLRKRGRSQWRSRRGRRA